MKTPWQQAKTPAEVGELTALWLEGKMKDHPYPTHPTEVPAFETLEIVPFLARLDRGGFLTDCSQPGMAEDGSSQRAFVSGFADLDTADSIGRAIVHTRLVALQHPPGQPPRDPDLWLRVPVTLDGDDEFTWIGAEMSAKDIRSYYGGYYHRAVAEWLAVEAWYLEVFDPAWGYNGLLWRTLVTAF